MNPSLQKSNSDGFSLIELLVIMIMIAVVLGIAVPNFTAWVGRHKMNAAAQEVYFDLQLARASAIKNNNNVVVTFNGGNHTYSIHNDIDNDGNQDAGENVKNVGLKNQVQFGYNPGITDMDGNNVTSAIFFGGSSVVIFNARGESDRSGSLYLINPEDLGKRDDQMRAISIIQATGAVDLYSYPWS